MNKFYIYFHINPIKKEVFYVGKGSGKRAYDLNERNDFWKNTVNKYGEPIIIIVKDNISETYAFELEKAYIKILGRRNINEGTLVNLTEGGEGTSGYKFTDETKKVLSNLKIGIKKSEEHKKKMSISAKKRGPNQLGRKRTEESKKKSSESAKNRRNYQWITNDIITTTISSDATIPKGFRKGRKKGSIKRKK